LLIGTAIAVPICVAVILALTLGIGPGSLTGARQAPLRLIVSPALGAAPVASTTRVSAEAVNGVISSVSLTGPGLSVHHSVGAASWRYGGELASGDAYRLRVAARSDDGKVRTDSVSFTTLGAPIQLQPLPGPIGGQLGPGAVIKVQFGQAIATSEQAEVADAVQVQMSQPETIGWYWVSPTNLDMRPQSFWPQGEQVTVSANFNDLVLDDHPVENSNFSLSFDVTEDHHSVVNLSTDMMSIYDGSQLLKTVPISGGQAGFPTISGTLVVLFKSPVVHMVSTSIGIPAGSADSYDLNVYDDVAISDDGYYVHDASWDVGDHGVANVSYGCVEEDPSEATWFYNWSLPGDVVQVEGSTLAAGFSDGEGDWNLPWSQWTVLPSTAPTPSPSASPTPQAGAGSA
jgi:lipoprotein-anchoring transpeptidase ErfK/SrfK